MIRRFALTMGETKIYIYNRNHSNIRKFIEQWLKGINTNVKISKIAFNGKRDYKDFIRILRMLGYNSKKYKFYNFSDGSFSCVYSKDKDPIVISLKYSDGGICKQNVIGIQCANEMREHLCYSDGQRIVLEFSGKMYQGSQNQVVSMFSKYDCYRKVSIGDKYLLKIRVNEPIALIDDCEIKVQRNHQLVDEYLSELTIADLSLDKIYIKLMDLMSFGDDEIFGCTVILSLFYKHDDSDDYTEKLAEHYVEKGETYSYSTMDNDGIYYVKHNREWTYSLIDLNQCELVLVYKFSHGQKQEGKYHFNMYSDTDDFNEINQMINKNLIKANVKRFFDVLP